MNKALYYPYINIPKGSWLTQSLLYWDELSCIAPSTYFEYPDLYDRHMQEYIKEQLVIPLSPEYFIGYIKGFRENFLNFIDNDTDMQKNRYEVLRGHQKRYTNIHFEKLGPLCNDLVRRSLAFSGRDGWLLVESNTAMKFMTYLAMLIGSITEYDPITREDISSHNFKLLSNRFTYETEDTDLKEYFIRADELRVTNKLRDSREKILTNLLPAPKGNISATEILRFKEKNDVSLKSFRDYIENFLLDYESTKKELKHRRLNEFLRTSKEMKEDIEEKMNEIGWIQRDIFSIALYGLDILKIYNSIKDGDLGNGNLGLTTFGLNVLKGMKDNRNRLRELNKKPMAYIVNANIKFGK